MADSGPTVLRMPGFDLPSMYSEPAAFVAEQLSAGRTIESVIQDLLAESYTPEAVVGALRCSSNLALDDALAQVLLELEPIASGVFASDWARAETAIGRSLDDVLAWTAEAVETAARGGGEFVDAGDLAYEDIAVAIVADRFRSSTEADAIEWLLHQLDRLGDLSVAERGVVYLGVDEIGCPAVLISGLVAGARIEDASQCRWPLEVIARHHGVAEVARQRDSLAAGDERERDIARMWTYWIGSWD